MKWSQFWKTQLWICFATTVPFVGSFILSFFVQDRLKSSYDDLVKPVWAPPRIVRELCRTVQQIIANLSGERWHYDDFFDSFRLRQLSSLALRWTLFHENVFVASVLLRYFNIRVVKSCFWSETVGFCHGSHGNNSFIRDCHRRVIFHSRQASWLFLHHLHLLAYLLDISVLQSLGFKLPWRLARES